MSRMPVANKITAVISRGEIRDYLDALSIRESKRFSDTELYRIAKEHDETFSPELFAESLSMMTRLPDWRFDAYVTRKELKELRKQAEAWMESIRKDGKESQSSKRDVGDAGGPADVASGRRFRERLHKGGRHAGRRPLEKPSRS